MDNFYLRERLSGEEAAGRASVSPGLFYRFRVSPEIEFVCFDTSKEDFYRRGRLFEYPKHAAFMERAFPARDAGGLRWRIPFGHHPPFCAGPQHGNTDRMQGLVRLFEAGGVRACFSGHEHNFQHSHVNGIDYFVSGAGSKVRRSRPSRMEQAGTQTWSGECHFLLVTIDGTTMTVRAIGEGPGGTAMDVPRLTPGGEVVVGPITLTSP
jgi:hypothetical protein